MTRIDSAPSLNDDFAESTLPQTMTTLWMRHSPEYPPMLSCLEASRDDKGGYTLTTRQWNRKDGEVSTTAHVTSCTLSDAIACMTEFEKSSLGPFHGPFPIRMAREPDTRYFREALRIAGIDL